MTPTEANRALQRYAKQFHAGAFATPTLAELEKADVRTWGGTVGVARHMARPSRRRDWTGRRVDLPGGVTLLTHIGRDLSAPIPDFAEFDVVTAYREDEALSAGLVRQGYSVWATQISAASEIIALWARPGWSGVRDDAVDLMTVAPVPFEIPADAQDAVLAELVGLEGWDDDYPFYSDGSWSALSLRGYRADDPSWGVKPAEMNKKWKAAHPEALDYPCEWTTLAAACPTLRDLVAGCDWWGNLERVRLLRMAGRDGRGGKLGRHTDITDRSGGTQPGQVVRFHTPLITDPAIRMRTWDLDGRARSTHFEAMRAWYLDVRKPHAVVNPTGVDRIHLVADVVVDPAVRAVLADCAAVLTAVA